MNFTAKIIADYLKGEVVGDPEVSVSTVSKIEEGTKGSLTFLANSKYEKYLYSTEASIVLINNDIEPKEKVNTTLIKVDNAYSSFASLLELYQQQKEEKTGIEDNVSIHESATIGENLYAGSFTYISQNAVIGNNVKLYPQVYIGDNVVIGDNTVIHPGVKIYEECIVGANCIIHAGTVIGSDGFGFAPQEGREYKKIPQIGNVIIEDNVELGSNVSIDRATMGSTILREGVKLDNLIQIAHNVEVGSHTVIAAQTGIAGSTKIGNHCMVGAQSGIVGHIKIANNVKIGGRSGVGSNVKKEGVNLLGTPAHDFEDAKKSMILMRYLPDMRDKLRRLEDEIKQLKENKQP